MNFRSASILFACLFSGCTASASSGDKPWLEIRCPHFRVLTDGNVADARKVAYEFEQLRNVFANQLPNAKLDGGAPLLVFAVQNEESARKLERRWNSGANRAGEFLHGWEKQYAIVLLDSFGGQGSKEVVYHEYTHFIEHLNAQYLPLWLDEGIAEYYAYTRFGEHKVFLGEPTERYRTMNERSPIPVEVFINLSTRSPYYLDGGKNQLFYAEAWALVHFLINGKGMEHGKRLTQFSDLLQHGVEQKKAFNQIFGDFKKIDNDLQPYMRLSVFTTTILKDLPRVDPNTVVVRATSLAETDAEIGAFHIWMHDLPEAHKLVEESLKNDPKLGIAHESMGFLDFDEGKDAEAEREFSQACALDGSLYLSLFYKTMLSPQAHSDVDSDMNAFGAALGHVLQLKQEFAPAYVQLAKLALREGDLASALKISRKAEELELSLAGYHLLTGQILRRMGNGADAAISAQYVADRWFGADHDEAVELWNSVPMAQRPAGESIVEMLPKDTQTMEGTVKSVACADHDQGWAFVLNRNGESVTFHHKGGFAVGYSDTLWYGADHFSLCHHIQRLRAVVRYRKAADATYAGDVAEIEIRDDLPQSPTEAAASARP